MNPILNIAIKAARKAGAIINRSSLDLERNNVSSNLLNDYVAETSRLSEHVISEVLLNVYPDHDFIGKNDSFDLNKEFKWIVCGLDGLENFIHCFPFYSISISLMHYNNIVQSVVYDPVRNELFTASRGAGTFLNDRRVRVSGKNRFGKSLISIQDNRVANNSFDLLDKTIQNLSIRKINSCSLALAYVACGRLEAFLGSNLSIFDMAAGGLLSSESGGLVADYHGDQNWFSSGQMLAATPKIFAKIVNALQTQNLNDN
ncbi:inositol monophosphatase family protein [Candidatus Kinetoplastidibacterium crithidiae]|uniref:Inositol-1-monophosphatase n=1 Tax=Candidatus Kinetoplastidibacterium crithidiae TCC036E TaxID=1208918 RepID=M1L3Y6_9PROT|nr:inositol monophosphatase family protein [Candidatus Kinetoplastibacterium crithidii]AFZ83177.1 inositol-1-monophosphatase [Candidatus Kinetoplastibacterium crithidii (ex Angomonas deanei ATCC 30255)]AGF47453.1 inositol-1-monophosphatase [Candidatus Kinetoplastibacterium crithidii TCC036E]EPY31324.1 myo-inositol-1(or 4)-monophosphatase [Angomonas deanei]|eukprot:EPY31324.1 myo-inositol-1(or 4)-monophosphatase [Angomonas deanei]